MASVTPYRADADQTERAKVAPFLHNTDTPWHRALERPGPGIEVWQVAALRDLPRTYACSAPSASSSCPARARGRWPVMRTHACANGAMRDASSASSPSRPAAPTASRTGLVYEATMRCNLTCEFCYVGDLLNLEGEWRQEMTLENLRRAFPQGELQVSLTGGEIFMRKDIMAVLDLFQEKGYSCGYLTTNGTIINDERADALASWRSGVPETHQRVDRRPGRAARQGARREGHLRAHRRRPAPAAGGVEEEGRGAARQHQHDRRRRKASRRSTRSWTSPRNWASTPSASIT